ncbi:MAG: GIY-YIG nuclease family protein [Candidatus Peregrinibacteria bacterium]|nr:GIY-YIG nuclease family protein [Candidatus Peregrinibacteria bacterium]
MYSGLLCIFVYVLRSTLDRQLYVGFSTKLRDRLLTHNAGKVRSTKSRRPWHLVFFECYSNKSDALRREQYFKTTMGKRALKLMLRHTLQQEK